MCKKLISLALCLVMLLSYNFVASAEDDGVAPAFDYTNITMTSILYANKTFYCEASADGYNGITTKIEITMTLQKKGLLWWSKVQSWSGTYNKEYATLSKSYATTKSGKYRVKAVYKVYSGSDSEKITSYSGERSI